MTDLFSGLTQEIISGIALGSIYALIALGFTMIFKATEVVNFAQGELMMVGAYVNFFFVTTFLSAAGTPTAWTFLVALGGSMIFSVLFGYILDFIINRPLKDQPIFSIIMATLSLAIIIRAVVAIIAGPISLMPFSPFGDSTVTFGNIVVSLLDLSIIGSAIGLVIIFYYIFHYTRWGIAMQATSEDPIAAQLMGIPIKRVYALVWIFFRYSCNHQWHTVSAKNCAIRYNHGIPRVESIPSSCFRWFWLYSWSHSWWRYIRSNRDS